MLTMILPRRRRQVRNDSFALGRACQAIRFLPDGPRLALAAVLAEPTAATWAAARHVELYGVHAPGRITLADAVLLVDPTAGDAMPDHWAIGQAVARFA